MPVLDSPAPTFHRHDWPLALVRAGLPDDLREAYRRTIASFFALLKIDPWEKLGFYRDHVDKAEQIILGRTRPPVGESKVVTGSRPATPAPKEPEPPAPQPWTVDVYREGD